MHKTFESKAETQAYKHLQNKHIVLVVANWNAEITHALRDDALAALAAEGWPEAHIEVMYVPGSFELCLGAKWALERGKTEAVICLGLVVQGETRHFDFICDAVANGLTQLSIISGKPVVFGVLTTENLEQAKARTHGPVGKKGSEAAYTALQMLAAKDAFHTRHSSGIGFGRP